MAGMTEMVAEFRERQELVIAASAELQAALKEIRLLKEGFHQAGNVIDARTRDLDAAYEKAIREVSPSWWQTMLDRLVTASFAVMVWALVQYLLER